MFNKKYTKKIITLLKNNQRNKDGFFIVGKNKDFEYIGKDYQKDKMNLINILEQFLLLDKGILKVS